MRPAFRRITSISSSSRTLSISAPRLAATATLDAAPSPAASKARVYTKRVATPASSSLRPIRAALPRSTPSASAATSSKSSATAAATPAKVATATKSNDISLADFPEFEEDDHSLPDISAGIDDYANLVPPPPAAVVRRPRLPPSTADIVEQPTPSPPLSSLPSGVSTLPIISTRQPDIQGEQPIGLAPGEKGELDWSTTFAGLGQRPFDKEVGEALLRPLDPNDVEVKPDGLLYLPEIKYRRTLNAAFGPGGWGLAPRGETNVGPRIVSREWGLIAMGRLVSVARGEQEYFDPSGVPTATEACKSNALMRCCKDLGIASELWDPRFIREFKVKYCAEVFTEHMGTKRKKKMWRKKDAKFEYPYKEG